jgi:hypothetical protein
VGRKNQVPSTGVVEGSDRGRRCISLEGRCKEKQMDHTLVRMWERAVSCAIYIHVTARRCSLLAHTSAGYEVI